MIVAELKAVADNSLPEMNHGVDEENEKLRAELDAVKGEIELRVDRIQELKECRTDLHFSKLEKVYSFYLDYRILYGSFFKKKRILHGSAVHVRIHVFAVCTDTRVNVRVHEM